MKIINLIICVFLLSGCESFNLSKTVAGGQNGQVDYCVRVMNAEVLCIHAKRTGNVTETNERGATSPTN